MSSGTRDAGRYEMLWDCPSCGTLKLLGLSHRHCPNCGAAQDPGARYFPSDADKVAVEDHPYTGADKRCPACDSPNAAIAHNCVNCGSPLDEGKAVTARRDQVASAGSFAPDSALAAVEERRAASAPPVAAPPRRGLGSKLKIALVLGLLAIGGCVALLLWSEPAVVEVEARAWSRTIAIQELRPVRDSAWRDGVPSGAREVSCSREVRSHRKIPDGEDCHMRRQDLGDGTYKEVEECRTRYREEPVHDDRCSFKIDRWVKSREARAEGGPSDEPAWPRVQLSRAGSCVGCEREGRREEAYEVTLLDAKTKREDRCTLPQSTWLKMSVKSRWKAKRGVVSKSLDCDQLAPE